MRKVLAVCNDLHAGSKMGLLSPKTELFGEDERGNPAPYAPKLSATQDYLWEVYTHGIQRAFEIADGDELLLLVNGDIAQGWKYPHNLVSTRVSDQIIMASAALDPWYAYPRLHHVRLAKGTEAHNFGEGSAEDLTATILTERYKEVDTRVSTHGLMTYNDALVDYAHKGPPPGSREWLKGNTARFYLRDLMLREILAHRRPPDIVLRAHFHTPIYETLEMSDYTSSLFVVPPLCVMDEFAVGATGSVECVTNGILVFEIVDGAVTAFERIYDTLDLRTQEVL